MMFAQPTHALEFSCKTVCSVHVLSFEMRYKHKPMPVTSIHVYTVLTFCKQCSKPTSVCAYVCLRMFMCCYVMLYYTLYGSMVRNEAAIQVLYPIRTCSLLLTVQLQRKVCLRKKFEIFLWIFGIIFVERFYLR